MVRVSASPHHIVRPSIYDVMYRRDYRGHGRTGAVCGADEAGNACVMRDGGKPAPKSASCLLVDDQFAYIPRELADTFFRTNAAPTTAFTGPNQKAANRGKLHYVII